MFFPKEKEKNFNEITLTVKAWSIFVPPLNKKNL